MVASHDRQHWFRIDTDFDGQVMTARTTPLTQVMYFAYFEPYSWNSTWTCWHRRPSHHMLRSKSIWALRWTARHGPVDADRCQRPHSTGPTPQGLGDCSPASRRETMAEWFWKACWSACSIPTTPSAALLQRCVFHVVPNMNPDGSVRGNLRTNAAGANLNREWSAPRWSVSPEVALVRAHAANRGGPVPGRTVTRSCPTTLWWAPKATLATPNASPCRRMLSRRPGSPVAPTSRGHPPQRARCTR